MQAEQYFLWGFAFFMVLVMVLMQWHGKLPTMNSLNSLANIINSRGGNIMVLGGFSILFFVTAIRFTYWIISKSMDGKVTVENSVAMAAFTWITGSAFGGSFTSMVKAMTGENTKARSTDGTNNDDSTIVSEINTQTTKKVITPATAAATPVDPSLEIKKENGNG